ncbi:MAG: hypothetical protein HPY55_05505 [Firmicutes bacterium]|nr:hypothetical protein [Bacillota bacterium]
MEGSGTSRFVHSKGVWWPICLVIVVLFGILYEFPVLGFFNTYPGQVLNYILFLNVLYFIIAAWIFYRIILDQSGEARWK